MGVLRRHIAIAASTVLCCALAGCGGKPERPAREIKLDYISALLEGTDLGGFGTIKAESYDKKTLELIGIQIDLSPDAPGRAERGEIVVDTSSDTMRIKLFAVRIVDVDSGAIVQKPVLETEPVALDFDAIP